MINWPIGKSKDFDKIKDFCTEYQSVILDDHLLAVDPGSKALGWASFRGGVLEDSGVIKAKEGQIAHRRLRTMYDELYYSFQTPPKILAIEKIRGRGSSHVLVWSVGIVQTAVRSSLVYEVPINFWKVLAKLDSDYTKSDEADAIKIGEVMIKFTEDVVSGRWS